MKLKNLFLSLIAGAAAFVGCTVEGPTYLSEIKVSSSYVTLNKDGGSATITYVATESWSINECPNWVTISPMSGNAGEGKITFTASEATSTNEGTIYINCGKGKQTIKLLQQCEKQELPIMTVAEIMAAGDGTYRAKGVCTNIYNTTYGNWHLIDETGDMTIYGTLDASGAEKNFLSLGIEEGDIVTVEGPYQLYGTTPELVNVTVIAIEKSLIKVSADDEKAGQINVTNLEKEGGEFVLYLVNKGEGFGVNVPDEAKSWLSFSNLELVDAASNLYKLTMNASANNAGARSAAITLKTSKGGKEYTATATLTQEGSIVECSIAEFLAAEVGSTQYKLSGFITDRRDISGHKFDLEQYGNFDITDATGNAYVYGVGAKGDIAKYGVKEGDIITLVGLRADYKGSAQMGSGQYESHKSVTPVTAAEAAALADDDKNDPANYIRLTGKVAKPSAESGNKFDLETYGNFDLVDESGSIYVYGVSTGWNGETKKFGTLGVKEGDIITIVAYKTSYKEKAQVVGMYVSHEEGKPEPEPEPGNEFSTTVEYTPGTNSYNDGVATVNEVENVVVFKTGTSKAAGDLNFTIPAGKRGLRFYAVAWKGNTDAVISVTQDGTEVETIEPAANDGATGNSPYTLTVAPGDQYELDYGENLAEAVTLNLSCEKRVIYIAVQAF